MIQAPTSPVNLDKWFLLFCETAAARSKDPRTKIGAIIVRDRRIISTGYNGFPPGVKETVERWEPPEKYDYVIHAEENAILQSARFGTAIEGATMYSLLKPCKHCAKLIAGSGLHELRYSRIVTEDYDRNNPHNLHDFNVGDVLLREAGVGTLAI